MPRPKRAKVTSAPSATRQQTTGAVENASAVLKESSASRINASRKSITQEKALSAKLSAGLSIVGNYQNNGTHQNEQATEALRISPDSAPITQRTDDAQALDDQLPSQRTRRSQRVSERSSLSSQKAPTDTATDNDESLDLSFDTAIEGLSPETTEQRVPNTPSMLSISNFKRRPRQPSLLRMVQMSAQKTSSDFGQPDIDSDDGSLGAGADDTLAGIGSPGSALSTVRKRKSSPVVAVSSTRPHKRRSIESAEVQTTAQDPHDVEDESFASAAAMPSTETDGLDSPIDEPIASRRASRKQPSAGRVSHSLHQKTILPETPRPAHSRRVSARQQDKKERQASPIEVGDDVSSPLSSPPPIEITQEEAQVPSTNPSKSRDQVSAPRITTASLQSLMPKIQKKTQRRSRFGSHPATEAFNSSDPLTGDSDEEDDPADVDFDSRRENHQRRPSRRTAHTQRPTIKPKGPGTVTGTVTGSAHAVAKATEPARTRAGQRTYGSGQHLAADAPQGEEDEEDEDAYVSANEGAEGDEVNESSMLEASQATELKYAARKFEAVDAWELEFESCDLGGEASSPWR